MNLPAFDELAAFGVGKADQRRLSIVAPGLSGAEAPSP